MSQHDGKRLKPFGTKQALVRKKHSAVLTMCFRIATGRHSSTAARTTSGDHSAFRPICAINRCTYRPGMGRSFAREAGGVLESVSAAQLRLWVARNAFPSAPDEEHLVACSSGHGCRP